MSTYPVKIHIKSGLCILFVVPNEPLNGSMSKTGNCWTHSVNLDIDIDKLIDKPFVLQ